MTVGELVDKIKQLEGLRVRQIMAEYIMTPKEKEETRLEILLLENEEICVRSKTDENDG
jgi:hypothetical protein